ncbi:MAG: hypothetical protein ACJASV_003100, partial [Pseudorhodobacter sp.]
NQLSAHLIKIAASQVTLIATQCSVRRFGSDLGNDKAALQGLSPSQSRKRHRSGVVYGSTTPEALGYFALVSKTQRT